MTIKRIVAYIETEIGGGTAHFYAKFRTQESYDDGLSWINKYDDRLSITKMTSHYNIGEYYPFAYARNVVFESLTELTIHQLESMTKAAKTIIKAVQKREIPTNDSMAEYAHSIFSALNVTKVSYFVNGIDVLDLPFNPKNKNPKALAAFEVIDKMLAGGQIHDISQKLNKIKA